MKEDDEIRTQDLGSISILTTIQHPLRWCYTFLEVSKPRKQMFFHILGGPPWCLTVLSHHGVQPKAGRYNLKPDFLRKRSKPIIMTRRILWPHFLCLCLQIKALCEWLYTHMQTPIHTSVGFCLYTDANHRHSKAWIWFWRTLHRLVLWNSQTIF